MSSSRRTLEGATDAIIAHVRALRVRDPVRALLVAAARLARREQRLASYLARAWRAKGQAERIEDDEP